MSKQALLLLSLSCASMTVHALPCRYGNCPGEVGKEGTTSSPPPAPVCPPQDGADCPHSCGQAKEGPCPTPTPVTYLTRDDADKGDPRASCDHGKCTIKLVGDLYLPADTSKKHPAIVFNHGSSGGGKHKPESICAIATYFLAQGYVIFMPHRRGYDGSTGQYGVTPLETEMQDVVDGYKLHFEGPSAMGAAHDVHRRSLAAVLAEVTRVDGERGPAPRGVAAKSSPPSGRRTAYNHGG